jgi:hypothetical protein
MNIAIKYLSTRNQIKMTQRCGVYLNPCIGKEPKVILVMKCRLGNQLHQLWIAQFICDLLCRPLHVIFKKNTEGCDIFKSELLDIVPPQSFEHHPFNNVYFEPNEADPFQILFSRNKDILQSDVIVDVGAECWTYIGEHEDYIRSLYKIKSPLDKKERIIIHLRLGDVAHMISSNKKYLSYCVQTVKRILKMENKTLPIFLLAEEPQHEHTCLFKDVLYQELGQDVNVFCNVNPADDFRELSASSHIIATNSTFTFWAAFLADPSTTKVYIGLSNSHPCASHRNEPLFLRGSPANFQITDIDKYQSYIPSALPPKVQLDNVELKDDIYLLTITTKGYIQFTENLLLSLKKCHSNAKLIVACLDKESFDKFNCLKETIKKCIPIHFSTTQSFKSQEIYGTSHFNIIMFFKLDVISQILLHINRQVVYVDSDIVFLKDPLHSLLYSPLPSDIDMMFQCDEYQSCNKKYCTNICGGLIVARNTPNTQNILNYNRLCDARIINVCTAGDQTYLNLARNKVKYDILPKNLFPNGTMLSNIPKEAILIHYNWLSGADKIDRMKANNHWYLS